MFDANQTVIAFDVYGLLVVKLVLVVFTKPIIMTSCIHPRSVMAILNFSRFSSVPKISSRVSLSSFACLWEEEMG